MHIVHFTTAACVVRRSFVTLAETLKFIAVMENLGFTCHHCFEE